MLAYDEQRDQSQQLDENDKPQQTEGEGDVEQQENTQAKSQPQGDEAPAIDAV